MVDKCYVTTAIDYVNARPHIGHAYQKIVADAFSRWKRLCGVDTLFVTGTDEHGKKVEEAAKSAGLDPQVFVDQVSQDFVRAWDALGVVPDRFIRTTDVDHRRVVEWFINRCNANGDIYKGSYEGYYCTGCEVFYTDSECPDRVCPVHKRPLEFSSEETYFFRLSKYTDFLLKYYDDHPEFILPASRKSEIVNRLKDGLRDLSITRTSFDWGIPFPLEEGHVTYVWFDALINYLTATRTPGLEGFWGSDTYHLLGKDNTWFHTVYWPAMLKSAGLPLPTTTWNHGFLSFNGEKISKSLGNTISPLSLVERFGSDAVRYFCLRQFPFAEGVDGDFSEGSLFSRYHDELADKFGNLVSRVSSLVEKYGLEDNGSSLVSSFPSSRVRELFDGFKFDKALNELFSFVDRCNEFVQDAKPWDTGDRKVLFDVLSAVRLLLVYLFPVIPSSTKQIADHFGFEISFSELEKPLPVKEYKKAPVMFPKLDESVLEKPKLLKVDESKELMEGVASITYADFEKLDLRVGEIQNAEEIEGADKLYKLTVGLGDELRTICAGIKPWYTHEDLKGKRVIVLTNLEPRKLRGIESQGMLLAASTSDKSSVSLLTPDAEIAPGSKVS